MAALSGGRRRPTRASQTKIRRAHGLLAPWNFTTVPAGNSPTVRCHTSRNVVQEKLSVARKATSKAEYVPAERVRWSARAAAQRTRSLGQHGSGALEVECGQTSVIMAPGGSGAAPWCAHGEWAGASDGGVEAVDLVAAGFSALHSWSSRARDTSVRWTHGMDAETNLSEGPSGKEPNARSQWQRNPSQV